MQRSFEAQAPRLPFPHKDKVIGTTACATILCALAAVLFTGPAVGSDKIDIAHQQVPTWSQDDLNFFLHGSMSTEVFPEPVLRAFIKTYPDLFPTGDLSHLGLIPDPEFGWPVGFSRRSQVEHLGGMPAVGINCASCHVAQITSLQNGGTASVSSRTGQSASLQPIRILGVTSHFDVEAFFGSVLVSTFKTSN